MTQKVKLSRESRTENADMLTVAGSQRFEFAHAQFSEIYLKTA